MRYRNNDHREMYYGTMSEKEELEIEELIIDLLIDGITEDELSDKLGDKHTDEMWLWGILEALENEGKIYSRTTYTASE